MLRRGFRRRHRQVRVGGVGVRAVLSQIELEEIKQGAWYDRAQKQTSPALDDALERDYNFHGGVATASASDFGVVGVWDGGPGPGHIGDMLGGLNRVFGSSESTKLGEGGGREQRKQWCVVCAGDSAWEEC
ncbi:hypothetical protein C1H46_004270 [Malus baccata]|uniref:Uncharacterized protein n=1 Tax=Malus baccata TaxID=106549 RepID=A0A540NHW0_MALBA|nr:hypothetical protein C1H46_004270 [Malus baccata]